MRTHTLLLLTSLPMWTVGSLPCFAQAGALIQQTASIPPLSPTVITAGHGSITDAQGVIWTIQSNGSIKEQRRSGEIVYTPGGGGTSALTSTPDGSIYGQDDKSFQWFKLNGGTFWTQSPPPPNVSTSTVASALPMAGAAIQPPPVVAASPPPVLHPCDLASGGQFAALGQIFGPDQQPFVPYGVAVIYDPNNHPSASQILAAFPKANMVRLAIYHYDSASSLKPYVDELTKSGLVALIEDHHNNSGRNGGGSEGTIFTGSDLATELAWHTDIARTFINNPNVWEASNNEPSEKVFVGGPDDGAALSQWQLKEYQAVRATGNNNPFLLEMNSWGVGKTGVGYDPAVYAQMNNVAWDLHWYPWLIPNKSSDQGASDATLSSIITETQQIKQAAGQTMPVVIGETGNSTNGTSIDPNWQAAMNTVANNGHGFLAWAWGPGDNAADGLTSGGMPSSPYGQLMANAIATHSVPLPSVSQAAACAATSQVAATHPLQSLVPQNTLNAIVKPPMMGN
jgi:hypothetical protein